MTTFKDWEFCYSSIEEIKLPRKLVAIGSSTFFQAKKLKSIDFSACEDLIELPLQCFSWCTLLDKVKLPPNLRQIPINCFNGCSNLVSINVTSKVECINESAFESSGLAEIRKIRVKCCGKIRNEMLLLYKADNILIAKQCEAHFNPSLLELPIFGKTGHQHKFSFSFDWQRNHRQLK